MKPMKVAMLLRPPGLNRARLLTAFALICLIPAIPGSMVAQDQKAILGDVARALGAGNVKTIQFSGMGSAGAVGQNKNPRLAWPLSRIQSYRHEMDLAATTSRVRIDDDQYVTSASPWHTQFDFWLNPFGFLKGAMENNVTVRRETLEGESYVSVAYLVQNKYRVVGYINAQNLIERVRTWIDDDVLGDMPVEAHYSVYKDFGGVNFPAMMIRNHGGFPTLILGITDVKANLPLNLQPPPGPISAAGAQAATVRTEKIADGIYYLKGSSHHSVAVEFTDHVAVIEAPLTEERSLAVIAEVKKRSPGKPIRYVINTHHHFDHSGGLRAYVAEGAAIVTHQSNKDFYERAFATARSLNPGRLEQAKSKANIETVADKRVFTDGIRSLELHWVRDNPHSDGMLMAFLPKEKIVIEADMFRSTSPPAAETANLVSAVESLRFDFERILSIHGSEQAARAELYAAVQKPVPGMAQILNAPVPAAAQTTLQTAGQRGLRGQAPGAAVDPGAALLEGACTGCHSIQRIQNKKAGQDEWTDTVERMKGKGAEISDDETRLLIDYLARTYK